MHDEFAVDESGMTSDGYRRLLPVCKKAMYVRNIIVIAILAAMEGAGLYLVKTYQADTFDITATCAIAVLTIIIIYLLVSPQVFYRRYRYRIDDEKAEIRRGVITITHSLVPIERIHQVQVSKGPINRMFGLANVNITTAGGVSTLEYLDIETAESIASKLNECVVKMLKARD
jgi:hypothetical protein